MCFKGEWCGPYSLTWIRGCNIWETGSANKKGFVSPCRLSPNGGLGLFLERCTFVLLQTFHSTHPLQLWLWPVLGPAAFMVMDWLAHCLVLPPLSPSLIDCAPSVTWGMTLLHLLPTVGETTEKNGFHSWKPDLAKKQNLLFACGKRRISYPTAEAHCVRVGRFSSIRLKIRMRSKWMFQNTLPDF